jgi:hypothetical protein
MTTLSSGFGNKFFTLARRHLLIVDESTAHKENTGDAASFGPRIAAKQHPARSIYVPRSSRTSRASQRIYGQDMTTIHRNVRK